MAKILIVDDDPDIALAARIALENAGHTVVEARNQKDGLAAVKSEAPDLIILDVMMDTATAGFQAALALRSNDPDSEYKDYQHIPIIMLTSIHSTTNVRFGPDEEYLPVEAFIDKPIEPESFIQTVARLLQKQPQ